MVTLLGIVLTGAALIREREHGTIEHLLVMPLPPARQTMLAKVWANALVTLMGATFALVVIVQGLLGVPNAGSLLALRPGPWGYLFSLTVRRRPARHAGPHDASIGLLSSRCSCHVHALGHQALRWIPCRSCCSG